MTLKVCRKGSNSPPTAQLQKLNQGATRIACCDFIDRQMSGTLVVRDEDGSAREVTVISGRNKCNAVHYGYQELKELLDFIYGPFKEGMVELRRPKETYE